MTETKIKRGVARFFAVFTAAAVVLNVIAFSVSVGRERWTIGFLYLVIAFMLAGALWVGWKSSRNKQPYQWRRTGIGTYGEGSQREDDVDGVEPIDRAEWWRAEFDVDPLDDQAEESGRRDRD